LAAQSPHAVVRIEALGHVEGASSERLRLELRSLLEDREPGVRLAALRAMEQYAIRAAGPFLVLRIKDKNFDKLPYEERRQALFTLSALAAGRTEAVCLEILNENRMLASEAHEQTRELAASVLGSVARSEEAVAALQAAANKRWLSSDRVRMASQKALEEIGKRSVHERVSG
jgi:HEAT repeat protein